MNKVTKTNDKEQEKGKKKTVAKVVAKNNSAAKTESNLIGKQILTHLMVNKFKAESKSNATLKEAELWYSCFVDSIKELLRQEKEVRLTSFATFSIRKRAARIGFNPKSKQKVSLPESKRAYCRMSKQVLLEEAA
jgi:nucleoid DNA-binding protein